METNPSSTKIPTLIYEDNKHLRDSLYFLLNTSDRFTCPASFPDTRQVLQHIKKYGAQLLVMDIEMPFMNGIETTRLIKQEYPDLPILILTVFDDQEKIFQSLCAGGSGYLLKTANPEQILQALTEVQQGGLPLTPSVARKVAHYFRQTTISSESVSFNLTTKETELLQHMVEGKSYKMSAEAMHITVETVKSHVKNIYRKLHVNSSSEAVAKALKYRIV